VTSANYDDVKGWKIFWQVPNIDSSDRLVVGDWFMDLEMGFTPNRLNSDEWYPYLFSGSDAGDSTRTAACNAARPGGAETNLAGTCYGFTPLHPGEEVAFRSQVEGSRVVAYVNLPNDGAGFLKMGDRDYNLSEAKSQGLAMYGHDVETFGTEHPFVSCSNLPLRMLRQEIDYFNDGYSWLTMGGEHWERRDNESSTDNHYKFINVNVNVTPSSWEVCSV
jgi:hypothetical protein